jgi:glycine/D-amino acid oxidase-like deaminating enzyme
MSSVPREARVVVIGAGIVGNSLACHLARLGWTGIVQLDKGPLPNPGGSTGHASNFIFPVDHSREMTALTLDSMRQYKALGVFTVCGGIEVARTEERMEELRRRVASAKAWGGRAGRAAHPRGGQGARPLHRRVGDPRRLSLAGRRRGRLAAGWDADARGGPARGGAQGGRQRGGHGHRRRARARPARADDRRRRRRLVEVLRRAGAYMGALVWAHVLLILGFLAYLPHSKHLHIVSAALNVWFGRTRARGRLEPLRFDEETPKRRCASASAPSRTSPGSR